MSALAVTGSTGALGGLVARAVADLSPRLVVRDPGRAPDLGGEVRTATYADLDASRAALDGVDVLFMVSASSRSTAATEHRTFIRAATEAGVRHVVYTSFAGAAPDATFTLGRDHFDAEQAVRETGMDFTFLRDDFYLDVLPGYFDAERRDPRAGARRPGRRGRPGRRRRGRRGRAARPVRARRRDVHPDRAGVAVARRGRRRGCRRRWAGRCATRTRPTRRRTPGGGSGTAPTDWQLDAWVSTYRAIGRRRRSPRSPTTYDG